MNNHYPFELKPLSYAFDALEPYIDEKTMQIHHDRHLKAYVDNLNAALKDYPELWDFSLELLLFYSNQIPAVIQSAVINNGGGVYNHNFFFENLSAPGSAAPSETSDLMYAINQTFGSFDEFKAEFKKQALSVFGSGYTWLVIAPHGNLEIINTRNQDTVIPLGASPIMCIDVWEHAYYLKHYNERSKYIDDWFEIVDLNKAELNFISYGDPKEM